MNISINPVVTTNAAGTFNISSTGYIQGTALNDPAIRNQLAGGILAATETLPMWGGVAISENVPGVVSATTPNPALGGQIIRATQVAGNTPAAGDITGFSVFDQDHSMVSSPQSQVPLAGGGMSVHFYRLGSGARIAVACDPFLVGLEGGIITQQVSWDFNQQQLVAAEPTQGVIAITSQTWSNTNGGQVAVVAAAAENLVVGDRFTITGAAPAGYNGDFEVNTKTDTTHFTYLSPGAAAPGGVSPATTPGSIAAGGGILPVRVLDVQAGNSMTVQYSTVTGFANWNRTGTTAIILI